jgi:cytochrome b561
MTGMDSNTVNSNTDRYSGVAIAFHWLLALMICISFGVGLYMTSLAFSPQRLKLYNWHKWAGVTILVLSAARLLWRLAHRAPPLPLTMPAWQRMASHASHFALYLFFFAVPITGWLYSSAAGFPIVWFGLIPIPDLVEKNRELAETLKPFHWIAAYSLATVVVIHIAAALKHHFIDRDTILKRMMPQSKKSLPT